MINKPLLLFVAIVLVMLALLAGVWLGNLGSSIIIKQRDQALKERNQAMIVVRELDHENDSLYVNLMLARIELLECGK